MNKIQELEEQLAQVKKESKIIEIEKIKTQASQWIGKCFSSHLFQRKPKVGTTITLRKIIDVDVHEDFRVSYKGLNIEFHLYPYYNKFDIKIMEYNTQDQPFPSWISSFSHEISEELFNNILGQTKAHAETYFDTIKGLFKQQEYICIGDNNDENIKMSILKEHFSFIVLEENGYENIKDLLSWNHHPFIYGKNQLLFTKESIEIVKNIADKLFKNATNWGGTIYNRDYPRAEKLMEFYKKYIKDFKNN